MKGNLSRFYIHNTETPYEDSIKYSTQIIEKIIAEKLSENIKQSALLLDSKDYKFGIGVYELAKKSLIMLVDDIEESLENTDIRFVKKEN